MQDELRDSEEDVPKETDVWNVLFLIYFNA